MTRLNSKPKTCVARARRAKAQKDAKYAKSIRDRVAERDGYCALVDMQDVYGPCSGRTEWAHFGEKKRFKTRGLPPEERHTEAGSFMACHGHHGRYDRGLLKLHGTPGAFRSVR